MMTNPDNTTFTATDESPAAEKASPVEIVRIYHYWITDSKGDFVDQEIEVEGATCIRISPSGHHYIETVNGFGMIMPPGWAFIEVH
jgi:hypothetical protein